MSKSYINAQLKKEVYQRAKNLCEYCLIPEIAAFSSHQIDHIIAEKHGGLTTFNNLALSCSLCNKYKGSDLTSIDPITGEIIPLFNPRQDVWLNHFNVKDGIIIPLTSKGRVTGKLLRFNLTERIEERKLLIEAKIYKFS